MVWWCDTQTMCIAYAGLLGRGRERGAAPIKSSSPEFFY